MSDIGSVDAFRKTFLDAKSVGPKDSASGVHIQNELSKRMGIEPPMNPKATMAPKIPTAPLHRKEARQPLEFLASPAGDKR
ncbi:hypothetical protein [Paraburkholderia sp. RL17-337-BIB-A]|uniref:hypothetical protein n=1 Tax=Paraburkholderia sp. RL17-337-BIB-A TaxID=3031636 RepID=UPI0038B7ED02